MTTVAQRSRVFPVRAVRLALETASVAVAAWLTAAIVYRVWDLQWSVPIAEGSGDGRGIEAQLKTIDETGWWVHNPKLGYPFGQFHADFPAGGETLQHFALKLMLWVTPGPAQTMNLYYLGGFGVLAAVSFLVARYLRFAYPIAFVLALAYTMLPFHFVHQEVHLHRSTYFTAPLACLLLLWALSWRTSFLRDPDPPPGVRLRANLRRGRILAAIALAIVIAISETMTTSFTMALLGASAIVAAIRWREPQRLLVAGALIAVLAGAFFVASAPTVVRIAKEGKNPWAAQRLVSESERYALRLNHVLLPPSHRLGAWARQGERARTGSRLPRDNAQYLGLLGVAGFLAGLLGLLTRGLRGSGRRDLRPPDDRQALVDHSALLMTLAVLLATVAGFSIVLGLLGFAQVRTWGRIVVVLGFFALLVTAVGFEQLGERIRRRARRPGVVIALLTLAFTGFVIWDQVTPQTAPQFYETNAATWASDERFVTAIEERMPDGAAIFQLPVVPFPESRPVGRMVDYDLYRGYVHDDGSLRWSYGGVKGRPNADWQLPLRDQVDPVTVLPGLLGMGYDGLWVDTFGYPDGGAALRPRLDRVLRERPLRSENGRLLFYDLSGYKRRLGDSEAELRLAAQRQLGITPPSPLP